MLEVHALSASYGKHRALENASLNVGKGEIVVILGANGAGKTTLLKAICGICEGSVTGSVSIDGIELSGRSPDQIVEEGVALVPEGRGIFGDLSVQENLLLGAYAKRARDEQPGNLEMVFSLFPKLAERRKQTARTMSGGEQQMVAIGRAMMSNPAVLILDEPSLGLSPMLCKDLFQSLKAVRDTGLGILLVEQNAKQSLRVADRGYLLENGEIVHEDEAAALANDPAVQKAYLGGTGARPAPISKPAPPQGKAAREAVTPSDIAAAALETVDRHQRPKDPMPKPIPTSVPPFPRSIPALPDTDTLVARASSMSSRRPPVTERPISRAPDPRPEKVNGASPPPAPTLPDQGSPSDRLKEALAQIEDAARRAESYRPATYPTNPRR